MSQGSQSDKYVASVIQNESTQHDHYGEHSVDVFSDTQSKTKIIVSGLSSKDKSWISMSNKDFAAFIRGASSSMQ